MALPMIAQTPAANTAPYLPVGTIDPSIQAKIDEMNMIIAMQQQQLGARAQQQQQADSSGLSGQGISSLLSGLYKGGQQAGIISAPRAQLVKMPGA